LRKKKHFWKFEKLYLNTNSVISEINRVLSREADARLAVPTTRSFVVSSSSIRSANEREGSSNFSMLHLRVFGSNIVEALRSLVRRRRPVFCHVLRMEVLFSGELLGNSIHGTVVILSKKSVYKFYFKDSAHFEKMYEAISDYIPKRALLSDCCFSVNSTYVEGVHPKPGELLLLKKLQDRLTDFQECAERSSWSRDIFSLRYRVEQMHVFHDLLADLGNETYLGIVSCIESRIRPRRLVCCHGDLWIENVLKKQDGTVTLLDFDKALYFLPEYDLVYYLMTSKQLKSGVSATYILANMDYYSSLVMRVQRYLGRDSRLGDVVLSIFLYAFLRSIEEDLHRRLPGRSASSLLMAWSNLE